MSFSLVELQVLNALAEELTLAEIGSRLTLGSSAVSKVLRIAERKAGFALVGRVGRRVRLTPAGMEVARAARALTLGHEELDQLLREMRLGHAGALRIAATNTPGNHILAVVVGEFLHQVPNAKVALSVIPPEDLWASFVDDNYDLAVGPLPPGEQAWDVEPLYEDELRFFVAPTSPLATCYQVSWNQIARHTVIGPFTEPYWAGIWSRLREQGAHGVQLLEMRAHEGVKRLVRAGGGVGLLFGAALWQDVRDGHVVLLNTEALSVPLAFWLVRRHMERPLPALDQFCMLLRARVQEMFGPPGFTLSEREHEPSWAAIHR